METKKFFIAEKLAHRPRVVFNYGTTILSCVLLNQVRHFANSGRNLSTAYDLREDPLDLGVHWELLSDMYSAICILDVRIFVWKQISQMEAIREIHEIYGLRNISALRHKLVAVHFIRGAQPLLDSQTILT